MTDPINYEAARMWFDVIQTGALLALWIYMLVTRRSKDNSKAIGAHEGKLTALQKELVEINKDLEHAPSHQDIKALHSRVSGVKDQVSTIAAEVSGIAATVKAIDNAVKLLNRSKIGSGT